jgi:HlyD family secretion protein
VERTVELGQTVVASMSTPQLFLIANDLSQMQILASVDESDIGAISEGQNVRFSVQAYPNEHFEGEVKQVRLQSKTTENVVNYTVVVRVANNSGKLLPGMTATLDFLTGTAMDALLVPNSALRFRPTEEMRAQVFKRMQEQRAANGGGPGGPALEGSSGGYGNGGSAPQIGANANGSRAAGEGRGDARAAGAGGGQFAGRTGGGNGGFRMRGQAPTMLWFLDEKGELTMARVRTGLTDGQHTVVESPRIKEGMQVIIAVNTPAQSPNATNPFGPTVMGPQGGGNRRF